MAATTEQRIQNAKDTQSLALPVASGETMYRGTLAGIAASDGLLYNIDAALIAAGINMVALVADSTANTSGPAATTGAGSISGTFEEASADAGDKTVRECYIAGRFKVTLSGAAQTDVGKKLYATDNLTFTTSPTAAVPVGRITNFIGTNLIEFSLNEYLLDTGALLLKGAIDFTDAAAGGAFAVANPTGTTAIVERLFLDITTASTAADTIDAGVAANATTTSDTLIDGGAVDAITIIDNITDAGTNGGATVKWTSTQYITGDLSAASTTAIGTYGVIYREWV